ncbi:MAG: hypothetical protein PHY54_17065 [Methylococcales bacterium]|nr:hypothetical protein [Methylococcales bacterium]
MRIITRGLLLMLASMFLISCNKTLKPEELPANIAVGGVYYTQFVIRYEDGAHLTTNYRRGEMIPVNTPVRLLNITNKTIEVQINNSSQKLLIKNVEKHTGDNVYRAFDKLFSKKKINLSRFTPLESTQIDKGTVANGMSKAAVIVAIGYPPVTQTPNLDSNKWVYWSGRFNRFNVYFTDGKVSKIED